MERKSSPGPHAHDERPTAASSESGPHAMSPRSLGLLVALFLSTAVVIVACSKSTSPSYGGGGGGGMGGGPSFNLTFPATGSSRTFQFTSAGSWAYHCTPHQSSGMTGTVVVSASSVNDSMLVMVGPGNTLTFSPNSVTIKPNGNVRWVNQSSMTIHTVTR